MKIHKIVITGGPCGGKSTGMEWIKKAFNEKGYTVLFIPETATELITGGVAPWTCKTNREYQILQMQLQLKKEALFERAAKGMNAEKMLVVCDRGTIDNKAYMNDEELNYVLNDLQMTEQEMKCQYDAVFHLVTAAIGAESFYTTENNGARIETKEEAAALDEAIYQAWLGHPYLKVIDNSTNFELKMKRLIEEIESFLDKQK